MKTRADQANAARPLLALLRASMCFSLLGGPAFAQTDVAGYAFAQLTAEHEDGDGGADFGADRVRLGGRVAQGRFFGGLQLDLNNGTLSERPPGTLPNVILDVFAGVTFDESWSLKLGQFKTPLGMDFNISGRGLDITKRGMEAGLVLNRDLGVMLSGRKLGGRFGVDLGLFNPAGRSAATSHEDGQAGEDNAWAVRGHYDEGAWHAELALGGSPQAGGAGTADYEVFDAALAYRAGPLTLKGELISGDGVRGDPTREESVWYLHAGYRFSAFAEGVVRHYQGRSEVGGSETDLGNTYVGVNLFPAATAPFDMRVQINYVLAGADESSYTGVRGFRGDALLLQWQIAVSN